MVKKDTTVVSGLFVLLHFFGSFCDAFNPIIRRTVTPILVYSTPGDGGRHTYVEGEDYDDLFSEIEAMGGGTQNCPVISVIRYFFSIIYSAKLIPSFLFILPTKIRMDSFLDPFFLQDEESEVKMATKESEMLPEKSVSGASPKKADGRSATDGMGPTPRKNDNVDRSSPEWEWDGTVDEEAHLGWDE